MKPLTTNHEDIPHDSHQPADCPFPVCRIDFLNQIQQVKQEWESTADSVPQLIFLLDRDGHVLRANKTLEQWGLGRVAEIKGHKIHHLLHPDCHDTDCYLEQFWNSSVISLDEGCAVEYESEDRFLHRHLHLHFRNQESPEQTKAGFYVVVIDDITKIKQAEKLLQNSKSELEHHILVRTNALIRTNSHLMQEIEERKRIEQEIEQSRKEYQRLVSSMNEGLAIIDTNGRFTYTNKRLGEMLGYECEELLGRSPMDFINEESHAKLEEYIKIQFDDCLKTFIIALNGRPNKKIWAKISPSQLLDKSGRPAGGFAVITDITDQVQMENALRESEYAKRQLMAQVMSAQEKERKRIASELHDGIGQTLSAIKFYVENAIRHLNEDTLQESVQMFGNVIPKLQGAIEEVRRISMDLRPSILDDIGIPATLTWFCREFHAIYQHIHIDLILDIQDTDIPTPLKVVIFRIAQEALNNAAKYSQANSIHLSLVNTGKSILLTIKDNGQGFDPAEVQARSKSTSGGMGLDSMRERAEFSGGLFLIESAKDKGTHMQVIWPFEETWHHQKK